MANLITLCSSCGLRNESGAMLCKGCGRPWSPETPPELESLTLSMVQLDENRRPSSVSQVRRSLAGIMERMSITRPTRLAEHSPYRLPGVRSVPVAAAATYERRAATVSSDATTLAQSLHC